MAKAQTDIAYYAVDRKTGAYIRLSTDDAFIVALPAGCDPATSFDPRRLEGKDPGKLRGIWETGVLTSLAAVEFPGDILVDPDEVYDGT